MRKKIRKLICTTTIATVLLGMSTTAFASSYSTLSTSIGCNVSNSTAKQNCNTTKPSTTKPNCNTTKPSTTKPNCNTTKPSTTKPNCNTTKPNTTKPNLSLIHI